MGSMLLGALLGANQSFERMESSTGETLPQSWALTGSQCSFAAVGSPSQVHSSATALQVVAGSSGLGTALLRYPYSGADDTARYFPDTATHAVRASYWARAADAPSSGHLRLRLEGSAPAVGTPVAHAAALQPGWLETLCASAAPPAVQVERVNAAMPGATLLLDDVLTVVDALTLHAEWSPSVQQRRLAVQHRSAAGLWGERETGRYWRIGLALHALTRSEADRLVWWWAHRVPLALTLDSSDSASTLLCQIAGEGPPISRRLRPYAQRASGRLTLESLDAGSLVF